MRSVVIAGLTFVLVAAGASLRPAAAQDDVQMHECVAMKKLMGREEGSMSSPQSQWLDGRMREVEKGDPGYAGIAKGKPIPVWIDLYGALNGHGNSLLGFYKSEHLKCTKVQG
jgi:hypothetical protein